MQVRKPQPAETRDVDKSQVSGIGTRNPQVKALRSATVHDRDKRQVTGDGGTAVAVTADGSQHWQIRWFPSPRHAPRTAPASPSVLPAGLPWLGTTATDSRHAWMLFASTNGSGASYLYATSDGGVTWKRITTFR